jgi:putative membrane protein
MVRTVSPAVASSAAVVIAGTLVVGLYPLGHESRHMALHIASMNMVAPLIATVIAARRATATTPASWLWSATLLQIVLLWAWHAPAVYNATAAAPLLQAALHAGLLAIATVFWFSVLTVKDRSRWHTIPALLLTGKLACLLAALLIFTPRTLYDAAGHLAHSVHQAATIGALDDQHLAGLLMITACPLSYLVAAVIIAAQLVGPRDTSIAAAPRRPIAAER